MPSKLNPAQAHAPPPSHPEPVGRGSDSATNPFSLVEYLQLAEMTKQSARIEVELDDHSGGHVEVVKGEVWNAEVELIGNEGWKQHAGFWTDDDALAIMLSSTHRVASVTTLKAKPPIRRIWDPTPSLMLKVAVLADHETMGIDASNAGFVTLEYLPQNSADVIRTLCEEEASFLTDPSLIGFVDILTTKLIPQTTAPQPGSAALAKDVGSILLRICACLDQVSEDVTSEGPDGSVAPAPEIVVRTGDVQCLLTKLDGLPLGLLVATRAETRLGDAYHVMRRLAGRFSPLLMDGNLPKP